MTGLDPSISDRFAAPAPPVRARRTAAGLAASAATHALALAMLLLVVPQSLPPPPEATPITVEIVDPDVAGSPTSQPDRTETPDETKSPAAAVPLDRLPQDAPAGATEATPPARTYTATTFYAAGVLNAPGMDRIRQKLGSFADSERVVQLCNIEGLEQVRRAVPTYDPDTLVGYAMSDLVTHGLTLIATGGAFRSGRRWYGISYSCTAAPGLDVVTAFSFQLGDEIPPSEWEAHNLNAEDADE